MSFHTNFVWRNLMSLKNCACCGELFVTRPQVPNHAFCSKHACQRERRQQWQRKKLQDDHHYRENLQDAQRAWRTRNPDYSRNYRAANPQYTQKNREQQRIRCCPEREQNVAKIDMSTASFVLHGIPAGVYRIRHVQDSVHCKTDAWIIEITPVCAACPCKIDACKDST